MNYRHAFHAGNFADVHKHVVLSRILVHLCAKPTPFRVLDTHAGAGLYDLGGLDAARTQEWRDGIGRLYQATLAPEPRALLKPYLDAVAAANGGSPALRFYPGSPLIMRALMRPQDRLTACELEPQAAATLARHLHRDLRLKAVAIDGWTALKAYVPPKERRGVVLIDPAYEAPDEFARLGDAVVAAQRKWPGGVYLLWYPIKERRQPDALARKLAQSDIGTVLRSELTVTTIEPAGPLGGSGVIVVNPPWKLDAELRVALPPLATQFARTGTGRAPLDWLRGEI